MPKEDDLDVEATLAATDYIRIVDDAGVSKKVLLSVLKSFINA